MALPTVVINNGTGSNTAASGAGPATALFGTGAATTGATNDTALVVDSPDLSGVATDGSAVLWVQSSSGRQFSKITAVNNATKHVTTEDNYANTEASRLWGIGGKRLDFETTNSNTKLLFADAKPGWTIDIQQNTNYVLTSTITVTVVANATTGPLTIKSSSTTPPTITSATNSVGLFTLNGAANLVFQNLKFTHTAATRGAALLGLNSNTTDVTVNGCICDGCSMFIDSTTNTRGISNLYMQNSLVQNCTSNGIALISGVIVLEGCTFYNNTGSGVTRSTVAAVITLIHNIFAKNGAKGFYDSFSGSGTTRFTANGNTFVDNTGDGCRLDTTPTGGLNGPFQFTDNVIWGNGAYGVNLPNHTSAALSAFGLLNRNNFYGSNTSGDRNILPAGTSDVTGLADPFNNRAGQDWSLNGTVGGGASVRAAGFPQAFQGGTTTGFLDGGAVQSQTGGGDSGVVVIGAQTWW